jgi:hypothetical protein
MDVILSLKKGTAANRVRRRLVPDARAFSVERERKRWK